MIDDAQFEALNLHKTVQVNEIPEMTLQVHVPLWQSALDNVLRNALRHSHTCVSVRFNMITKHGHDGISIVIEDDGEGVPEAQLSQLFEPFYRAKQTDDLSTGLGLAITKAAVDYHGGVIHAQNLTQGDKRTGFSVSMWFPLVNK